MILSFVIIHYTGKACKYKTLKNRILEAGHYKQRGAIVGI
jgi:hypothetical protein